MTDEAIEAVVEPKVTLKAHVLKPHLGDEELLMTTMGFEITDDPFKADVVVFTGGSDVSPHLYNETKMPFTSCDVARDEAEWDLCEDLGDHVIKVGLCRGAQFLCTFYGGKLWQDVDRHAIGEQGHWLAVVDGPYAKAVGNRVDNINSYHHQALRVLPGSWNLVAATNISKKKISSSVSACDGRDIEVADSVKDRVFAFQPHPEFYDNDTRKLFYALFDVFLNKIAEEDKKGS